MLSSVFFLPQKTQAQPASNRWAGVGIETNFMGGKIFKHTPKITGPIPAFSSIYEVNVFQKTTGRQPWQLHRHYPTIGVALALTDFGLDSVYGKAFSIYPNLEIPIFRRQKIEWTLRAGFGFCYATRPYKRYPTWDTFNNAIGSGLNNYTLFSTDLRYKINGHWQAQLGFNFSHMSNAAMRLPNYGLNVYGAHVGVRYFPVSSEIEKIKKTAPVLKNRWLIQFRYGMAINEISVPDGPLYLTYILSGYVSKRYAGKNKIFAGLDYSYHKGIEAFQKNNELNVGHEKAHSWKSAVFVGNEFLIGRAGILLQVGVYIREAALKLDPYYQKLGLNYYLVQKEEGPLKELAISVLLKTHKAQAELAEFGIGVGF